MRKTTKEESLAIDKDVDKIMGITPEMRGDRGDIYAPSHAMKPTGLKALLPELNEAQYKLLERYISIEVLEGKHDMISWALSRTSMNELKKRWFEIEHEISMLKEAGL